VHIKTMKYGYARVSTDGQSVDAQVRQLTKAGCKKVFRETASGANTDRAQLAKALAALDAARRADGDAAGPVSAINA
jgi:DNA invertase Pin-like site-specific DNA recombinase